jgi:glucosylglycerate synthase
VLAPTDQEARAGVDEPRSADIVVGVRAPESGAADALRTGHRIGLELTAAQPQRKAVVLLLADGAAEQVASPAEPRAPVPRVPILPWSHPGQSAIEALLRAAGTFDAAACALVAAPSGNEVRDGAARRLLAPVLEEGFDLVCPCYAAHRYEGVLTTGLVYPLTRALFGRRLRQPISDELAVSRRLADHLLGEGWQSDPHAGGGMWLVTGALSAEYQVCQAWLGVRPPRLAEPGADLSATLARVVGLLFHEMRLQAHAWQRVKGSRLVKTFGDAAPTGPGPAAPAVAPMLSAFKLGHQELQGVWGAVLPPQSLLALKRLAACPEERFAVDDELWARVVYDFAVGYHLAVMDRMLLLRSLTPLYLGWAASFVIEVRDLDPAGVDARVEVLCRAFESAKPYVISRWRWPDRFNP